MKKYIVFLGGNRSVEVLADSVTTGNSSYDVRFLRNGETVAYFENYLGWSEVSTVAPTTQSQLLLEGRPGPVGPQGPEGKPGRPGPAGLSQ